MSKACIICNGEPPLASQMEELLPGCSLFIAADGGGNSARTLGFTPDVVIGDLDSFEPHPSDDFPVIKDPGQETNDLEKAMMYALDHHITEVVVVGATGKRLDHALKNLSVMKQFKNRFSSIIFRDRYCDCFLIDSPFSKTFPLHTPVSLFPLSGTVENITTTGLKYPLTNEELKNGERDGSSNLTTTAKVEITHSKGDLLLFVNRNHPKN